MSKHADVEFVDKNLGQMLLHEWDGDDWLFVKGGEGQWVSFRKATYVDYWIILIGKTGLLS